VAFASIAKHQPRRKYKKTRSRRVAGYGAELRCWSCYRARRIAGSHNQVWLAQTPPPQRLDAAAAELEAVDGPVAQ